MDNITHSLIGLIAGDAFDHAIPAGAPEARPQWRRGVFVSLGVIGGNLPDIDLVYSYRGPGGDKFAYLLGHRGYTHTLVGCLVLAAMLYGGAVAYLRWKRESVGWRTHGVLAAVALVSVLLHLFMDALNSYGVHPFWPWHNGWIYGDSVFIVEPLYWAAASPLWFSLRSATARVLMTLALLGALAASVLSGMVAAAAGGMFVVCLCTLLWIGWRYPPRVAAFASAGAFFIVTVSFVLAGRVVGARVEELARVDSPSARVLDHVLTPMPANPACWRTLVLQLDGDRYMVREQVVALAPAVIPVSRCGRLAELERSQPFSMSRDTLRSLVATHCEAAALMQFARAPFALSVGRGWIMGDLRFDEGPKPGIADIEFDDWQGRSVPCPATPPWDPPRADLLAPRSKGL